MVAKNDITPTPKAIDSICFICGVVDLQTENVVIALVKRHEKEIRADQDKITRSACAKSINPIACAEKDAIYTAIMNTKGVK